MVVVVLALFFMKRRGALSSRGLAVRSRVVVVDSLKAGRREDGGKYKRAFKHPKKTCPEGYKAPRSIKRALMKAGGWRRWRWRSPQRGGERVESECASREC